MAWAYALAVVVPPFLHACSGLCPGRGHLIKNELRFCVNALSHARLCLLFVRPGRARRPGEFAVPASMPGSDRMCDERTRAMSRRAAPTRHPQQFWPKLFGSWQFWARFYNLTFETPARRAGPDTS